MRFGTSKDLDRLKQRLAICHSLERVRESVTWGLRAVQVDSKLRERLLSSAARACRRLAREPDARPAAAALSSVAVICERMLLESSAERLERLARSAERLVVEAQDVLVPGFATA